MQGDEILDRLLAMLCGISVAELLLQTNKSSFFCIIRLVEYVDLLRVDSPSPRGAPDSGSRSWRHLSVSSRSRANPELPVSQA